MAQYNVALSEISAEMLDELADFAHRAWGRTDILEVDVVPGQPTTENGWQASPLEAFLAPSEGTADPVAVAVPDPIPASPTGSVEIVLPPEPVDDLIEEPVPAKSPRGRR